VAPILIVGGVAGGASCAARLRRLDESCDIVIFERASGRVLGAQAVGQEGVDELPRDREIWVHCAVGQRSYYAARFLVQKGFHVKNLPGGDKTYRASRPRE
jgi:rhodanese-related sulfurtransferase